MMTAITAEQPCALSVLFVWNGTFEQAADTLPATINMQIFVMQKKPSRNENEMFPNSLSFNKYSMAVRYFSHNCRETHHRERELSPSYTIVVIFASLVVCGGAGRLNQTQVHSEVLFFLVNHKCTR